MIPNPQNPKPCGLRPRGSDAPEAFGDGLRRLRTHLRPLLASLPASKNRISGLARVRSFVGGALGLRVDGLRLFLLGKAWIPTDGFNCERACQEDHHCASPPLCRIRDFT